MKILRSTAVLFLVLAGCPDKGPADFRTLAKEAYPDDGKLNPPALDRLWIAAFRLPQWHFTTTKDLVGQKQPSIELIDGKSYVVVSTDLQIAQVYARSKGPPPAPPPAAAQPGTQLGDSPFAVGGTGAAPTPAPAAAALAATADAGAPNPYVGDDGKALVVSMSPEEAVAYLSTYSGPPLAGVRFNEGAAKGWYGELSAVTDIRAMLVKAGKL